MKKLISAALAAATTLSLVLCAGCGSEKGTKGGSSRPGMSNAEETYFMDMPSELKGTKVQFATWIPHKTTDTGEVIANFEQETGITVELVEVAQSDYHVKMAALINAGQSPDVVVENGDFPLTLNLLAPLTVEDTGLDVTDPFWNQELRKIFTVGKYCYAVNGANSSWDMAGAMIYFNKTILDENGIKTPNEYVADNNWNLDTMKTLMKQIQESCGFQEPGTQISETSLLAMFGGGVALWDPDAGKFVNNINSENNIKAYQWMLACRDEGILDIGAGNSWGTRLGDGTAAMTLCGSYGLRNKPGWYYQMDLDDLGFEVLPKVNADDADYPYTGTTRAYGICKGAKNPKGAAYFLRWFLNGDNYDYYSVFKNEDAVKMYKKLRENEKLGQVDFSNALSKMMYGDTQSKISSDVITGSSAQISVNLTSASNTVQAAVDKANQLIDDVIAGQ